MQFFKLLFAILMKGRDILQNLFKKLFDKVRDKNGKIFRGILSPNMVKPFLMVVAGIFFAIMMISHWWGGAKMGNDQLDKFRKEMSPQLGTNDVPPSIVGNFDEPLGDNPLGDMVKQQDLNGQKDKNVPEFNRNYLGVAANPRLNKELPTKDECNALMDKMKTGDELGADDKGKMNVCLDKNVAGWTPDQIQMAKALISNPDLTPEEKALLVKGLNGQLSPEELALARALSGTDETAKALAREAIKNNDEAAKQALAEKLMGKELTDRERGILADLAKKLGISDDQLNKIGDAFASTYGSGANGQGLNGSGINGTAGAAGAGGLTPEALAALGKDIQTRDQQIKDLANQLAQAQAEAAESLKKLAEGLTLTPEEQAKVDRFNELQKQLEALRKEQQAKQAILLKNASMVQGVLAQVAQTMNETVESGFSVAYEDAPVLDVKKIAKPIGNKITRIKSKDVDNVLVDLNGKPLSPDKVKLITIRRKNLYDFKKKRDGLTNPTDKFVDGNQPIDNIAQQAKNGAQPLDVSTLFFFNDKSLKSFNLTGDMKIPAVLQTMIFVSDKGHGQAVRVQTLLDIHNPEDNTIIIPKGSIIMGQTSQFDADTGSMDITLTKAYVGGGKTITQNFIVMSANGNPGLVGEVHDTRGKYLLGAFITAFSAGALNWFSQDALAPYTTATDAGNAMIGALGAGAANTMDQLSTLYAGDLQNAARLYYVAKGVPVILSPTE
jgi:hypothetical protein